jgi:hypothetical protein
VDHSSQTAYVDKEKRKKKCAEAIQQLNMLNSLNMTKFSSHATDYFKI